MNTFCNEQGSTTRILLLVLLLAAAAAGYLFYFTDYINPRHEASKSPVAQTAQVKQPIPRRPGQPEEKEAAPAKPGEAKPPHGTQSPPAAPPQGVSAPAPAPSPTKAQPAQKPASVPPPARPEPVKTAKAESPPKPVPTAAAASKPAPLAAPVPAPALAPKKGAAPVKTVRQSEKPAGKKKGGPYHLLIGDFVPDRTVAAVQAKLKKSGIAPVRKSDLKTAEPMNRLYVAEFTDQTMAELELQKLRNITADAFLIPENDKYFLYAGSYFSSSRAASELAKLRAKGVKPVIKIAQVTIKVTRITAGSYASGEEARKEALRLKKHGITATVIKEAG